MILLLSSKFQKYVAFFILLVFYSSTVLAGREALFATVRGKHNAGHAWTPADNSGPVIKTPGTNRQPEISAEAIPGKTTKPATVAAQDNKKEEEKIREANKEEEQKRDDIGGPDQPEMTAFKAAGADNMVDLFTGDFSYNIPLGDVGGYPINLFYNGGINVDQEASWVGLGWNINPGTIVRNKRGIPDDFNGTEKLTKEMNIKPQITVGISGGISNEFAGFPIPKPLTNLNASVFYNNYRGVGLEFGTNMNVLKIFEKNSDQKTVPTDTKAKADGVQIKPELAFSLNSQSGVNVNPSLGVQISGELKNNVQYGSSLGLSANYNSRIGLSSLSLSGEVRKTEYTFKNVSIYSPRYKHWFSWTETSTTGSTNFSSASALTFGIPSITPSINLPLTHRNYNLGVTFGKEAKPVKLRGVHLGGYYSETKIADKDKIQERPAFGYLYFQESNGNNDAMLDFNRLNDAIYTKNNPTIAMPNYTFDVFAINGQGIGGGFRAYRGDVGSVHDNYSKSRESAASIDGEIGVVDVAEFGLNLNYVHTPTIAGEWQMGNLAREDLKFKGFSGVHQAAYFKNPAEAAKVDQGFLNNLANEDLIRIKLTDPGTKIPFASPIWERFSNGQTKLGETSFAGGKTIKDKRDRRTQVISFLTAEEANYVGLDRKIYYYGENEFPLGECRTSQSKSIDRVDSIQKNPVLLRKPNHISEITVTQTDGKRYVYGIPVYNLTEEEVSFNVSNMGKSAGQQNTVDKPNQLVTYDANDLSDNKRGKDWFYQKDKVPAYAHSFLLTGLISPDYVDVSGDGITDDDLGTAVKFNYTKISNGTDLQKGFGWRAPFTGSAQVAYNEGLKTDKSDDKGHYTYGERELWYLNSIESKNMIATFTISSARNDGKAVTDAMGGRSTAGMRKLEKIDIYAKSEWVKTTGTKKPVKTIHFEYYDEANELCHGTPDNSSPGGGKLTLKRIWFTYNGNEKLKKNYYTFKYGLNPGYNRTSNDRWGTYKPASANQSGVGYMDFSILDNADFPFSDQDKNTADANVAAWTLNEITLPSGAKIKVDFESDDYAYVQDRRAAQMYKIAGFGSKPSSAPSEYLYDFGLNADYLYIFIDAPASSKSEIYTKYLEGINQLFMKLWVRMPHDQYSDQTDYEAIPVYALIEDYNIVNANRFWIKVKSDRGRYSPMFYNSMQFLIKNLSSKAYPGSDVKGTGPIGILKALAGMMYSLLDVMGGYYNKARLTGTCQKVDRDRSYLRLNNSNFKKLGGGLRVKKVTIKDSWKVMTSTDQANTNGMPESEYGQEYDYTTTALVNGLETAISSGVAAYEPAVGAEENPFREILRYDDRQPLGPNERGAIELPLGEVFYPSPSVGYSKVTVRSIHRDNVKSGVGKTVSEFFTTKDFPTKSDHIDFDGNSHYRFKSNPILRLLKLDVREVVTLSQGFRLQTNDMNGKIKTQTTYDENGKQITFTKNVYRIVKTGENKYVFDNVVPMMSDPKQPLENLPMGKEIEVMTDFREHVTRAVTFNMNFNINVNLWGPVPVPVPSIIPPVHFAMTGYRSASVVKIINTFGILEKVITIDKGSEVSTKDLAYDAETGAVLATETNNEFNKPTYSFSYPAHWAYPGMQGAYKNIDAVFEHLRFQNGKLTTPGFDMSVFESGDELYVKDNSSRGAFEEAACAPPGTLPRIPKPVDEDGRFVRKIWALDMSKDQDNTQQRFLFIDKNGDPYSGGDVTIKIIRSGKRNLVEASVGGFTSLASPLRQVGADLKLVLDDETKIINTTANTFKEKWRVDEAYYTVNEIQRVVRKSPILSATVGTVNSATFAEYDDAYTCWLVGTCYNHYKEIIPAPNTFVASYLNGGKRQDKYLFKSWVLFDFNSVPGLNANSNVIWGKITLPAHTDNHSYYVQGHYVHTNHNGISPHYRSSVRTNNFVLSRMQAAWPSFSNYNEWFRLHQLPAPIGTQNQKFVFGTPWPTDWSDIDYKEDITEVVKGMLADKFNPSRNYATALRINMSNESANPTMPPTRLCFENSVARPITIDLKYYTCNTSDSIVYTGPAAGAPTNPPPGYMYCVSDELTPVCYSHFTRKRINPYTKGVLGNWRADVGYVYYAERRETNAASPTEELSKGGVIATNYKSFWISPVSGTGIIINSDATTGTPGNPATWKWNSKVTQFNNKGFELENTDPLGRFNCGLYGYDKSLPVAVANNSKLRSAAYDGFEDYSYKANNCAPFCKPQRHLVIDNATANISNAEHHSGIASLKVAAGSSLSAHANVVTPAADALGYDINIQNLVTTSNGTWVNPAGNGIRGRYFNFGPLAKLPWPLETWDHYHRRVRDEAELVLNNNTGPVIQDDPYVQKQSNGNYAFYLNPGIKPPDGIGNRPPTVNGYDFYCIRWEGWVQAPLAGTYTFRVVSDDGMKVFAFSGSTPVQVTPNNFFINHSPTSADFSFTLATGELKHLLIYYYEEEGASTSFLTWRRPGTNTFETVPKDFLYVNEADANGTVQTGTLTCDKPDIIQVKDNALTDVFSPVQGQKMVFSTWVKEGGAPCQCDNYTSNQVQVFFNNSPTASYTFTPAGKIIEGWQRYEAVFDIPANATSMEIKLKSTGSKDVYWDDLRLHPYNANMKSFVYHPVSLRLMADQDENNYSSFYEYDDDGTLIRTKKETERGIKTITETRSAIQKKITE